MVVTSTKEKSPKVTAEDIDHLKDPYQMNNLMGNKEYSQVEKTLKKKLQNELTKIGGKDFKPRQYYLDKWNLSLNNDNKTTVDYRRFMNGKGLVQSPKLDNEEK